MDSLDVGVVRQGVLAELSADTGLAEATEGHVVVELVVAVDPDGTGVESVGDVESALRVLGEDGGGKAVDGVVGNSDDVVLVLELGDDDDWAEDLFLDDLGVRADVGEADLVGKGRRDGEGSSA